MKKVAKVQSKAIQVKVKMSRKITRLVFRSKKCWFITRPAELSKEAEWGYWRVRLPASLKTKKGRLELHPKNTKKGRSKPGRRTERKQEAERCRSKFTCRNKLKKLIDRIIAEVKDCMDVEETEENPNVIPDETCLNIPDSDEAGKSSEGSSQPWIGKKIRGMKKTRSWSNTLTPVAKTMRK